MGLTYLSLYNDRKVDEQMKHLQLLATLSHQFILKPKYAFQDVYNLYLIVEYIQGGDLSQNMKMHTFTESESSRGGVKKCAEFIISALLLVLQYFHNQKLIFTSLKPESILLDEKGYPKLHGLNNVRRVNDYEMGPPEEVLSIYLAPEVLLRQKNGAEADFYSLGMILFEMMTGRVRGRSGE